jgi:homocysteine S-methyltransferase
MHAGFSLNESKALMRLGVELACNARDTHRKEWGQVRRTHACVAVSMGSYGAFLADASEYNGDFGGVSTDELSHFHEERLLFYISSHTVRQDYEFLAFETIPCMQEVASIVSVLNRHAPLVKHNVWVSLCCKLNTETREVVLSSGELASHAIAMLNDCRVISGIGMNCCDIRLADLILDEFLRSVDALGKYLLVYPNGQSWDSDTNEWDRSGALPLPSFQATVQGWLKKGVKVVGGCCKVDFDMISALKNLVI